MSVASGADVLIVDAGGANLGSVRFAIERLGGKPRVSRDPQEISTAERVILPGVGAAAPAMQRLRELGLVECLRALTQPLLGICLGMQLLFEASEEGSGEGEVGTLGVLEGRVRALQPGPGLRIPHMGWNSLAVRSRSPLLEGVPAGAYCYFVHSFAVSALAESVIAVSTHGQPFAAAVARGNRYGVQFHPERSAGAGSQVLANFLALAS